MKHTIKKGDRYLCIRDYMDYKNVLFFQEGVIYTSTEDGTLLSRFDQVRKVEDMYNFFYYFKKKIEDQVDTRKTNDTKDIAARDNEGKVKWSLVHFKSLESMVKVLEFGAKKYDRDNWQKKMNIDEILDSTQRHLADMIDGAYLDEESGLPHAAHILCNMMFYNYHYGKE